MPTPSLTLYILSFCFVVAMGIDGRLGSLHAAAPDGEMIELTVDQRKLEGVPLAWDPQAVHLLGRDGRLWEFTPQQASNFHVTSSRFRAYSPSEFRAGLLRELGNAYEVSGTGHYLVAHPKNQRDQWAQRFEDLYRSFVHFFSVRGMSLSKPPFSLVGVVCRNQAEFLRIAIAEGKPPPHGVLGYYDVNTNRIILYDMGGRTEADWRENAAVLIHEATHQTAFNTGVHSRYCLPPTWLVEGLAMLFEAPGVYDSRNFTRRFDRVNWDRLRAFRQGVAPYHRPETLTSIVATDNLFRLNPGAAYAEAWAFTFFLVETEPQKYVRYLKRTASRPPFEDYTPAERTADFTAIFGGDWAMLDARFLRYMAGIK